MKKEVVSVLKPYKGNKSVDKVKKVSKKIIEKSIPNAEARGTKRKIVRVQDSKAESNLQNLTNTRGESDVKSKKNKFVTSLKNVKTNEQKKAAIVENKMAVMATEERVNEPTRGRPKKKPKIPVIEEPNVSPVEIKKKKKIKPTIESALERKPKPKVSKEKKKTIAPTIKASPIETSENVEIKTETKNVEKLGKLELTKQHVLSSVKAIKKLNQKQSKLKKTLLPSENHPIFLQVTCVKIPKTPRRHIRPLLPHALATPLDDIALFVPDLETGRNKDYEKTVEHYETLFREKGINSIKQIIPMNQIKTEYNQFEMKRKLASSFDYFLVDGRICGHLTHILGKGFFKRRDPPTPLKLNRDNVKREINVALHKTCLEVHSYGNTHTVRIGIVSMKSTKLVDNVLATCEVLKKEYPGGWQNIRSIQIKTQTGPAIPIYLTLTSKNQVRVPVVKPKRPAAYKTVEGELTTVPGNKIVSMTPEGKVKLVKKIKVKPEIAKIKKEAIIKKEVK